MATASKTLDEADFMPLAEYQVEDAPRLALEMVSDLQNRVQHPIIDALHIRDTELEAAIDLDDTIDDAALKSTFPHLTRLLEQKINVQNRALRDPLLIEQSKDRFERVRAQRQARQDAVKFKERARFWSPVAIGGAALVAGCAGVVDLVRPEILRALAQHEINVVATDNHTNRVLASTTPSGVTLKGVPIHFACIKTLDGEGKPAWQAGEIRDVYTDDTLSSTSYQYQVKFEEGVSPDLSVAEAGWGTTVLFPPEQVEANFPAAYGAIDVSSNGSSVYAISTGKFVADPENVLPSEFTTGEHAKDGSLVQYVLVSPDGPACAGAATDDDPKVKMVDATLDTEYPELSLENLAGTVPTVDGAYTEQFAKYGLDEWYSETFYPNLVLSFDVAIRDASRTGVSRDKLKVMSDFLTNRTFEKNLLRLLQYLEANVKKDTLQEFIDQIKKSNAPHFAINIDEPVETTATHGHGQREDEARQGFVYAYPSDLSEGVLFDGLIREISSASPTPGMFSSFTGNPLEVRPADGVFDVGIGYFLTEKGTGETFGSDTPSRHLIDTLEAKGKVDDVIRYWTFNPNNKLSGDETALFNELNLPLPASPRQQDFYDMILEVSNLDKPVAEVTEDQRAQLTIFVETHEKAAAGTTPLEEAAQTMGTTLDTLTQ